MSTQTGRVSSLLLRSSRKRLPRGLILSQFRLILALGGENRRHDRPDEGPPNASKSHQGKLKFRQHYLLLCII